MPRGRDVCRARRLLEGIRTQFDAACSGAKFCLALYLRYWSYTFNINNASSISKISILKFETSILTFKIWPSILPFCYWYRRFSISCTNLEYQRFLMCASISTFHGVNIGFLRYWARYAIMCDIEAPTLQFTTSKDLNSLEKTTVINFFKLKKWRLSTWSW